jgi:uncharacterized protein YgiM (DUF1202 family)
VSLPNDSSKSGFVREDQMANLGEGAVTIAPLDPNSPTAPKGTTPTTPTPEVVGPIQARDPAIFYIASRQANIRQDASANSAKVGTFEFSDPVTIVAQRSVGAGQWYQVQLPSGGTGWVNARLVSESPRSAPIDAPPPRTDKPTSDVGGNDSKPVLTAVSVGATMRVESDVANLRKAPGANGDNILEVLQRDTLMSVEDVRIVSGVPWYRVTSPNGAQGWVSGRTVVENN